MSERKVIFECIVGSQLYGTNRPDSDEDYQGVFLPSTEEVLGMQEPSKEWNLSVKKSTTVQNQKGDVDRKFYSLKRFLTLAAEGQPTQLEMLFAPQDKIITQTIEWGMIMDNRHLFLSRKGIAPFIGFALAQAHKATIKGENLALIRRIIEWYDTEVTNTAHNWTIKEMAAANGIIIVSQSDGTGSLCLAHDIKLRLVTNKEGFVTVELAGRNYDVGVKLKTFVNNLRELERKFGKRSQAAAESGYDYKSLMVAYRLLFEGAEFMETGKITLPRPEAEFLKLVKDGAFPDSDHFAKLTEHIDLIRQKLEPNSPLPEEPNYAKINQLCIQIMKGHIK